MKKILSYILAVCVLFSISSISGTKSYADDSNQNEYIVIIMDIADDAHFYKNNELIFTAESSINEVKEATKNFINQLSSSGEKIPVAVVTYAKSVTLLSDFTNDYSSLLNKIEKIQKSDLGRNLPGAIKKAGELLSKKDGQPANKDVVLVTDGFVSYGDSDTNGYFSSGSTGSKWSQSGTDTYYYAYSNGAIKAAELLKQQSTIHVLGLFKNFENTTEASDIAVLCRKTAKKLATSKDYYYELNDIKDIDKIFNSIKNNLNGKMPFTLGVNNNSFAHTKKRDGYPNAAFTEDTTHQFTGATAERFMDLYNAFEDDGGAQYKAQSGVKYDGYGICYGIAATMLLCYADKLTPKDLCGENKPNYYSMPAPVDNDLLSNQLKLFNMINDSSKKFSTFANIVNVHANKTTAAISNKINKVFNLNLEEILTPKTFFERVIKKMEEGEVVLLTYYYSEAVAGGGHAVLLLDHQIIEDNTYGSKFKKGHCFTVYDMNSVNNDYPYGFTTNLLVNEAMDKFDFYTVHSKTHKPVVSVNENSSLVGLRAQTAGSIAADLSDELIRDENVACIKVDISDEFKIETENGYIESKNNEINCTIPVKDFYWDVGDEEGSGSDTVSVLVPKGKSYAITPYSGKIDVNISYGKHYASLEASNIDKAVMSPETGITIQGKDYSFKSFLETNNKISETENGLVSVQAKASGTTELRIDNSDVSVAAEKIENTNANSYVGNDIYSISAKTQNKTSEGKTISVYSASDITKKPYVDVPTSGKWYSEAVYYATAKGYMAGTGNNKFSPDATVTRGTIAQILYAAEGKPAVSGKSKFADVGETKWYAKAVKWAADKGLVSGYGNGKFGPEDRITREQMVAIMMQYSKMKGYDTTANADLSKFRDQNTISKWAVNAVKWGVSHKIVSGTDKGIEPKGNATRAQIAVILQAYDKNVRK